MITPNTSDTKKRKGIAVGFALALALLLAIAYAYPAWKGSKTTHEFSPPAAGQASEKTVSASGASGAPAPKASGLVSNIYETIDELVPDSDVIAVGTFEGEPIIVPPRKAPKDEPPYDPGHRDLIFRPTTMLKGEEHATLRVAQRATFLEEPKAILSVEEDTLFELGATYVLFLKREPSASEEFYWVVGAMQGALRVQDGKVYSRNVLGEIPQDLGPSVQGQPLDSFLATLREKVNSK